MSGRRVAACSSDSSAYALLLDAVDTAGNHASPVTVAFKVIR